MFRSRRLAALAVSGCALGAAVAPGQALGAEAKLATAVKLEVRANHAAGHAAALATRSTTRAQRAVLRSRDRMRRAHRLVLRAERDVREETHRRAIERLSSSLERNSATLTVVARRSKSGRLAASATHSVEANVEMQEELALELVDELMTDSRADAVRVGRAIEGIVDDQMDTGARAAAAIDDRGVGSRLADRLGGILESVVRAQVSVSAELSGLAVMVGLEGHDVAGAALETLAKRVDEVVELVISASDAGVGVDVSLLARLRLPVVDAVMRARAVRDR